MKSFGEVAQLIADQVFLCVGELQGKTTRGEHIMKVSLDMNVCILGTVAKYVA